MDLKTCAKGYALLRDLHINKGTAFSDEEQQALGLEGLLPPVSTTLDCQIARVRMQIALSDNDLQKYLFLSDLQARNETLYYAVLMSDPAGFMPLVYTPTVGEASQKFDHVFHAARRLYLPISAKGRVKQQRAVDVEEVVSASCLLECQSVHGHGLRDQFSNSKQSRSKMAHEAADVITGILSLTGERRIYGIVVDTLKGITPQSPMG